MQQRLIATIALGVAITIAAAGALEARGRGKEYFTNLPVVTQDGKTLRFYDDLIRERSC